MAIFIVCRGAEANLPSTKTDGYAYFTTDTGVFYIDHKDSSNTLVRSKISAEYAEKLRYSDGSDTIEIDPSDILTDSNYATKIGAASTSKAGLMSKADKSKLDGITASADSVSFTRSLTSGTKVGTITINGTGTDLYAPTNTDTHYASGTVVNNSATSTTNTTSALTNGNVYMNHIENGAVKNSHKISGSGATTVTTDASGNIVIKSTDTNTTYSAATTSANGLMSSTDKSKLDGIASGAQVNQNAFSNVTVGSTTIAADSTTDTLTLVAGSNVTLTPDATNDKITIAAKDTTYSAATTSAAGLMSASDKTKLDGIATGANKYSLPAAGSSLGGVKTGGDVTISSGVITVNDDSHNHTIANVDGLQAELDEKSYMTKKYSVSAGDENTHYYKLFTITPVSKGYGDLHYVFDITARSDRFTEIHVFVGTANDEKYINTAYTTYDGSLGTSVTAYRFKDTTNKVETLEIWGKITSWDTWHIIPKTYQSSSYMSLEWNGEEGDALPTDATTTVSVSARAWSGNAATATKATQDGSGNNIVNTYATKSVATTSANGLMSSTDKSKLDGIASGAEVNQNAFGKVVVGSTTITADAEVDTLTLAAGSNITLTPDSSGDKITIAATDTTYAAATTSTAGLMSASDKSKLDGIAEGANKYTHPTHTAKSSGLYKITVDGNGHVSAATAVAKSDITALGIPSTNTTYSTATTFANGLMSSSDKTKLDGVATGAEVNQNAFSNVVVGSTTIAADAKTDTLTLAAGSNITLTPDATNDKITIAAKDTTYSAATTSAAGLMSASDKSKLDGITASADAVSFSRSLTSGTKVGTLTINGTGTDLYAPTNTDTHYTTGLKVGASATATANAAATNGNVYLNVLDNTTVRDSHKIVGSGATTVTSDANGVITISSTDNNTTYSAATTSTAGLMSAADKTKLDGIATGANKYSLPTASSSTLGGVKVGTNLSISDGVLSATDTTYSTATTGAAGLMSAADKTKLDGITTSADSVSFSANATSGNKVGTITINGTATTMYSPTQTSVSGNAGSATKLATARTIDGVSFNGSANITHYGTCSTAAATAAKTVAITGFTLATGARVLVKFTVTNTASSPTLNVNSTGAKNIMYRGSAISAGYLAANRVYEFVYDINTDTNTTYSVATTSANGLMSSTDKSKLDGIASGANKYTLPAATSSALGGVKVGSNITNNSGTISLTKANVTSALGYTPPTTNTTYSVATTSANGLMSSTDKSKLDGIATNANNYSHPTSSGNKHIPSGGSSGQILRWSADGTAVWGADNNTTYSAATQSAAGLMSAADKKKLDGVATNATKDSVAWTCTTTVSKWSRICYISGSYASYLISISQSQNSQATSSTFIVNIGYGSATISQIAASGYTSNNTPQVRVVKNTSNLSSAYIEFYNSFGYNSATTLPIKCQAIKLSNVGAIETYTSYTATASDAVAYATIQAQISGIVAQKFYGDLSGNATSATKATQDGSGNTITSTYATKSVATTSANGLMSSSDKSKLDGVAAGANKYTHPSYTARTGKPTANATPGFGGTFTVSQITSDATGHVTGATDRTITIPNSTATTSAAGLMSKDDKSKLDGIASGANKYTHPSYTAKSSGLYKVTVDASGHVSAATSVTKADITALGIPGQDTNTTYSAMTGATSSAAGSAGLVPAPAAGKQTSFLRGDGTWVVPTNTTYSAATTSAAGLMSASDKSKLDGIASGANAYSLPAATSSTLGGVKVGSNISVSSGTISLTKSNVTNALGYTPPTTNTTYSAATTSTAGLMSASDKSKLDGIASGANAYSLPTASSSTLGGVKTTSTVTSTSGLTACPIISGVPYYKDTNTTYSLGSFGVTATAAELNNLEGITDNVQGLIEDLWMTCDNLSMAIDEKADSSHNHDAGNITSGTLALARIPTGTTSSTVALGNHTHSGYASSSHTHSGYASSSHTHSTYEPVWTSTTTTSSTITPSDHKEIIYNGSSSSVTINALNSGECYIRLNSNPSTLAVSGNLIYNNYSSSAHAGAEISIKDGCYVVVGINAG